jgi:hypothetical protein
MVWFVDIDAYQPSGFELPSTPFLIFLNWLRALNSPHTVDLNKSNDSLLYRHVFSEYHTQTLSHANNQSDNFSSENDVHGCRLYGSESLPNPGRHMHRRLVQSMMCGIA